MTRPAFFAKLPIWLTSGDPNYSYERTGDAIFQEVLRRAKDEDEGGVSIAHAIEEWEDELGHKFTREDVQSGDIESDVLSDCCPDDVVFEVREDSRGHFNWGYFEAPKHCGDR